MLSIVVSWKDRRELERALPSLLDAADAVGGDVNVVNFGGSHALLRAQLGTHAARVAVVDVEAPGLFNKPCAQNLGAAHARHDILFFCDCDIIIEAAVAGHIARELRASPGRFATLAGVRESEANSRGGKHVVSFGYRLDIRTADGRRLQIVDHEEDAVEGTRNAPGLLFVRRDDFLRIDGYNSRLRGWGWEDQDMISRLTLGAGLERLYHGHAIHISHDEASRVVNYGITNRWESRDRMFRQALASYDDNDFLGTYRQDVSESTAAVLRGNAV
jgi:hypothetical protein